MSYVVRYSPSARKDIDKVWDDVFSASASLEVTERYITDFLDVIAQKKEFPESGIPLYYRGLFTGFYSVNFKAYGFLPCAWQLRGGRSRSVAEAGIYDGAVWGRRVRIVLT